MATLTESLLTAEAFALLPDRGVPVELIRGKVVEMSVPGARHGQICGNIACFVGSHIKQHQLGHFLTNDSGVVTERGPDSVRGADVAFYPFSKVPPGPLPPGYLSVPPDIVFEVRSPTDRLGKVLTKVAEYLCAGVGIVCVLNPDSETLQIYREEESFPQTLHGDDEFAFPELFGELRVPVKLFFA